MNDQIAVEQGPAEHLGGAPLSKPAPALRGSVVTPQPSNMPSKPTSWIAMRRSLPSELTIRHLYLDVTNSCNLECTYCFKGPKHAHHMSEATARNAIDWLLDSSGDFNNQVTVSIMGGEPLMQFRLIEKVVPYATRRALQRGKTIYFGATTNCTLVTDKVIEFWRKYGMTFHCSIDGLPQVQNANRPMAGGRPSASLVEQNVRKILALQPEVCARATVTPESAPFLLDSAHYFLRLGIRVINFVPGVVNVSWQSTDFDILRQQYEQLGRFYVDQLISGGSARIQELYTGLVNLHSPRAQSSAPCMAGGLAVMVDPLGDIYPCTAFGPHQCGGHFRFGTLGGPFNNRLREVFLSYDVYRDGCAPCKGCRARLTCRNWCYAACADSTLSLYNPGQTHCETRKIIHDEIIEVDEHLRKYHPQSLESIVRRMVVN